MTAPCKNCKERTSDCHRICAKYQAYSAENDQRRKQRYLRRQIDAYTNGKIIENAIRRTKRMKSRMGIK